MQKDVKKMDDLVQTCEQHIKDIRLAIGNQQTQLDSLKRRAKLLEDHEISTTALNELFRAQQGFVQQTDQLHTKFEQWEEKITRREDELAARREWSK
jgi:hypothetical protein